MNNNLSFEPDGIRVWRGFTAGRLLFQRKDFIANLKDIFIPQTAQQMMMLGLQSYFPAIVPKSDIRREITVPDEVALLIYPSDDCYKEAAKKNVAGRAYGALHATAFNFDQNIAIPSSKSGYPTPWVNDWEWDQSYTLMHSNPNWDTGQTSLLLANPSTELSAAEFYGAVSKTINEWLAKPRIDIDCSIICITEDYLLYWEHANIQPAGETQSVTGSLIPELCSLLETPYIRQPARTVVVPPVFTLPDFGVECEVGELLSLRVAEKGMQNN